MDYQRTEPTPEQRRMELIGNWAVGIAIVLLFGLAFKGSVIDTDPGGYKQLAIYKQRGYGNTVEMRKEVERLAAAMPRAEQNHEQYYTWLADVRIAQHALEFFHKQGDISGESVGMQKRLEAIDRAGSKAANIVRFNMGANFEAQEKYLHPVIAAATIPIERRPLFPLLLTAYLESAFLMLILMSFKAQHRGYVLVTELFTITRLPLAALFWPVCAFAYPFGAPLQSIKYAFHLAGFALIWILSLGGAGAAKAQTGGKSGGSGKALASWVMQSSIRSGEPVDGSGPNPPDKPGGSGKALSGWVIQSDSRWGEVVEGAGPNPQRQQRITITSRKGYLIENVTQSNDRQANNFFSAGKRLIKTSRFVFHVLPAFRITHDKRTGDEDVAVAVNAQLFVTQPLPKKTKWFNKLISATSAIQFERGVSGSSGSKRASFTFSNQTFLASRRGNFFPGWDTVIVKFNNRPVLWNIGPLLEWKFPKRNWPRFGIGYLRNQSGVGVLRFRLTETFSW